MPQLSIILTFYDETAFLRMAVSSVLTQGIDGLELIIVNDNPERFDQADFDALALPAPVRILHHAENKGLSAARNSGIAAAGGKWIGFLDADDYYTSDGLKRQFALARQSGADITHAPCYLSRPGTPEVDVLRRDALLFPEEKTGAGLRHFEETQFITSSWASLYRRDFLDAHGLHFDEAQPKFEDRLFVLQTVTAARKIATLGAPARVWRRRGGSISVSQTDPYIHRLQIQLLEKCLSHMRAQTASGALPHRFEKRELFNTVGRLIWDMDIVEAITAGGHPDYAEFAKRIPALLEDDRFGQAIFDDPILAHISRVGMKTRKGFITRRSFFEMHKALREGDFAGLAELRAEALQAAAPRPTRPARPKGRAQELILHLGMHKTGSTYIQHHLLEHRAALGRAGLFVPRTGLAPVEAGIRAGAFSGHAALASALREPGSDIWDRLAHECAASRAGKVLISCENLLFPLNEDRETLIARLGERIAPFASLRCVAFARRADNYIEALYKELVSNASRAGSRRIEEFLVDHSAALTDFPQLFAPFERLSGRPVTLLDFDAISGEGALWPRFCAALGIEAPPALDLPRYPSASREATEGARLVNVMIAERSARDAMLRDFFSTQHQAGDREHLLPPERRAELLDAFAQSSGGFAAERGYAPDIEGLKSALPDAWTPLSVGARVLEALEQARLRAELPRAQGGRAAPSARPGGLNIRIRPRPWLRRLLARLPV